MTDLTEAPDPAEELERLLEEGAEESAFDYLHELPLKEATRAVLLLDEDLRDQLLTGITPAHAAELMEHVPETEAADYMERLSPEQAAAIIEELPSDEQADLLHELDEEDAEAILSAMDPEDAQEARVLSSYEDEVAGGLMVTEYLEYQRDMTVRDVLEDLRHNAETYAEYDVQYAYVVDSRERLVGVLRLRDLVLAREAQVIRDFMIRDPLTVRDTADMDTLRDFFDRHPFFGAPVVTKRRKLVGVIQRADLEAAFADRTESDHLKTQGIVGGEELRTMPVWTRSRRRLAWLSVNILLNVLAASVIAFFTDTLSTAIALAVFLPIISDMSGCSGNQAVAVSMRELSLGLIRPTEALRVWGQEVKVGLINGLVLGTLLAGVAFLWKGNLYLGLVVGVALFVNTLVAVSIGGAVPVILRRLGKDPALASGPILTTITDICGFLLVLGLATLMLSHLQGM